MVSRNRDIATILGRSEAANASNTALGTGSGGGANLTVYDSSGEFTSTTPSAGTMAFDKNENKFFIYDTDSSGWVGVSLSQGYASVGELINLGASSGIYRVAGTDVWFDASIGWALYQSFSSDNTYDASGVYPAYAGNRLLIPDINTYPNDYGTQITGSSTLYGNDGANNYNMTPTYARVSGMLAFYGSGNDTATVKIMDWKGPANATQLRVKYGTGTTDGSVASDVTLKIGGTTIRSNGGNTTYTDTGSFNPAGSAPFMEVIEGSGSIAGISEIWFK